MPGGHLELNESFEAGLLREVKEETDLKIEVISPVATWHIPEIPLVGVAFACRYLSGDIKLTHEHSNYKWVSHHEIFQYIHKSSMIDNIRQYLVWQERQEAE